jgi:hypothetical protein
MHSPDAPSNARERVVALDWAEVDTLRCKAIGAPSAREASAIVRVRHQFDKPRIGFSKTNELHGSEPAIAAFFAKDGTPLLNSELREKLDCDSCRRNRQMMLAVLVAPLANSKAPATSN